MSHKKPHRRIAWVALVGLLVMSMLLAACQGGATTPAAAPTTPAGDGGDQVEPGTAATAVEETEEQAEPTAAAEGAEGETTGPAEGEGDTQLAEGEGTPVAAGEVVMWTEFTAGGEATGIEELIETWNAANPETPINHRPIGNEEFFTVLRTGMSGGEPPDIFQFEGYQQTRDFAAAGHLVDLTEWWAEHQNQFTPPQAVESSCMFEGKVYCIPYTFATGWQIYYNADLLAEHNIEVPTTMEEFLAAGDTLKEAGIIPIAVGGKDGWPAEHWWMNFLVQRCGVETVYQALRGEGASFTDECFVQAAADVQFLAENEYFSPGAAGEDYGTAQAVFESGQAAFFQTGSWFTSGWGQEEEPPAFETRIMPFPRWEDAANTTDVTGAVTHVWAVAENGRNKEGALAVLNWLAGGEAGAIWARHGNIAMIAGAVEENAPEVVQELWAGSQEAPAALPWIENEMPPGVGEDKVYNGMVALITGDMTPEEFTQSVQDAMEAERES